MHNPTHIQIYARMQKPNHARTHAHTETHTFTYAYIAHMHTLFICIHCPYAYIFHVCIFFCCPFVHFTLPTIIIVSYLFLFKFMVNIYHFIYQQVFFFNIQSLFSMFVIFVKLLPFDFFLFIQTACRLSKRFLFSFGYVVFLTFAFISIFQLFNH